MKRKIIGWVSVAASIGILILAILYLIKGNFIMAIGIPVSVYIIVKYLPYITKETKHEGQTH